MDHFRLQALQIEPDRPAELNIEILKGNMRGMGQVQLLQHPGTRVGLAGIADAGQVRRKVKSIRHVGAHACSGRRRPTNQLQVGGE